MARTRTTFSFPDDDEQRRKDLVAAAFILEEKSQSSLLYNSQVIDFITNSNQAGSSQAAWYFWGRLPELRYVSRYLANALSVATLYVGTTNRDGSAPTRLPEDHPVSNLMENFAGGFTGQSDLLDRLALHLTVAGDSILIGPKDESQVLEQPFDKWRVYSSEEVSSRGGRIYIRLPGNAKEVQTPNGSIAFRVWRPHPVAYYDADSPVKGSFQVLKELDMLNQHILASGASRLVGAGLLGIPEELDLPGSDIETEGTEVDQFVALLIEIMGMAKKNPESAAARIPIMMRGPAEYIDKIKHFDFSTEFSNMVPELRTGAIRRLALGMDVPPEILLGSENSNSWCLDDQSEVYTRRGWLSEPETEIGDECLSLNHDTGMSEWQSVTDVFRKDVVDEPMVSIEGSWHSSLTTLGHRWPVLKVHGRDKHYEREWVTSAEFLERGKTCLPDSQPPFKLQRAARLNGIPTEPKYTDNIVELVAWMFTEGSLDYRDGAKAPHRISLYQSHVVNASNCARIRNALTSLYGSAKLVGKIGRPTPEEMAVPWWREVQEGSRTRFILNQAAAFPIVEHCPHRMVDQSFVDTLTYSQLKLFIEVAALGDGHTRPTGNMHIGQKDPHMLDAVEKAAILAGLGVIRYEVMHKGFPTKDGLTEHLQHYVSITPNRLEYRPRGKNIAQETYTGRIWCPTVEKNSSFLMRRNGKVVYTGNSAFQTDSSTLRVHIVPMLQLICSSLTDGWLRPMMETIPLSEKQKEELPRIVIHFDVSKLNVHQDLSGDAQALYDRFGIDLDSLRLAIGYDANSAPDNDELAFQILLSMISTNQPDLVNQGINGLRDNFGITKLPKPPEAPAPPGPGNQPGDKMPPKVTKPIKGPLPGDRSQKKEVSPPPIPKPGPDQNNNAVK